MFPIHGKTVLILGLGGYAEGSGVSAALFCLRKGAKKVIVTDVRSAEQLQATISQLKRFKRVEYVLGKHRLSDVRSADLIIKNPGIPEDIPVVRLAKKLGKLITNDIGLFLAYKPEGPIVGITGTRGKSTTTTLIYKLLSAKYKRTFLGGNIGKSPLQFIDTMRPGDLTVLELSSWMLHDIEPQLDIAVVTNILPDHLNRYASMKEYQKDKEHIWNYQRPGQTIVLNTENLETKEMGSRVPSQLMWFGKGAGKQGTEVKKEKIFFLGEVVASVNDIRLRGKHNIQNALAAVSVAKILGIPNITIQNVLRSFTGIPNRLEHIRTVHGVEYYNDTTATTPDAAVAALNAFDTKVILIAGGNTKGLDLTVFAHTITKRVKQLILLTGNANEPLQKSLPNNRIQEVDTMEDAVARAVKYAKKGDVIVLSPGCTWLPLMNEFERGRRFVEIVKSLT